jgi:predicted nucleic acid-binding protein
LILVDNCIISSLSKIGRLDLLKNLNGISTSIGVIKEIQNSQIQGLITESERAIKKWMLVRAPKDPNCVTKIQEDHPGLSYVDSELIVLCKEDGSMLMTDDSLLLEIAEKKFDLNTADLFEFLIALKNRDILKRTELCTIISTLEKKDRYSFPKNKVQELLK